MIYNNKREYLLEIAGLKRKLPIIEIEKNKLWIASFVMLGDTELNYRCAQELIKKFPKNPKDNLDYIAVPEAKAIPLAHMICHMLSNENKFKDYVVLRKSMKKYMKSPKIAELRSITTAEKQIMVIDEKDAEKIKNKNVYTIDDVVSTGESYRALVDLVKIAGANIKFAGAVLREGEFDISDIEDKIGFKITFLEKLPIFER